MHTCESEISTHYLRLNSAEGERYMPTPRDDPQRTLTLFSAPGMIKPCCTIHNYKHTWIRSVSSELLYMYICLECGVLRV